jgi:hypothetical protein
LRGDTNIGFDETADGLTENVSLGNLDDAFDLYEAADGASGKKAGIWM